MTRKAIDVHGIEWRDVADAPKPQEILASFADLVGDAVLVGHYIEGFDQIVLRRVMNDAGLEALTNFTLDTCRLARRILPEEAHDLASLAQLFGTTTQPRHRALPDATANAEVFLGLVDRLNQERELNVLSEWLPLVALGIHAANVPIENDNVLLVSLGARVASMGQAGDTLALYRTHVASDRSVDEFLTEMNLREVPDDHDWRRINDLWRSKVDDYCRGTSDHSLPAFLHYAALAKEVDFAPDTTPDGRVTLMSIHSAKGKEWPIVFLLGAEDDLFAFNEQEIDEGRRILYVAMTRPKQRLIISWSNSIDGRPTRRSRFLDAIPAEIVQVKDLT